MFSELHRENIFALSFFASVFPFALVIRPIGPNVSSNSMEFTIFIEAFIEIVLTFARDELEPGDTLLHVVFVELTFENSVGEILDNELHVEVDLKGSCVFTEVVKIDGAEFMPSLQSKAFDMHGLVIHQVYDFLREFVLLGERQGI